MVKMKEYNISEKVSLTFVGINCNCLIYNNYYI